MSRLTGIVITGFCRGCALHCPAKVAVRLQTAHKKDANKMEANMEEANKQAKSTSSLEANREEANKKKRTRWRPRTHETDANETDENEIDDKMSDAEETQMQRNTPRTDRGFPPTYCSNRRHSPLCVGAHHTCKPPALIPVGAKRTKRLTLAVI